MKKIFKIYMLLFLTSLFMLTSVNAFSINMNLDNTLAADTTNIVQEYSNENDLSEDETLNNDTKTNDSSPRVTTTRNSEEDEFLTVENVLSIIIIVIGILLILLAIAILVRFK